MLDILAAVCRAGYRVFRRASGKDKASSVAFRADDSWVSGWAREKLSTDDRNLDITITVRDGYYEARRSNIDQDPFLVSPDLAKIYVYPDGEWIRIFQQNGKDFVVPVWGVVRDFVVGLKDQSTIDALKKGRGLEVRFEVDATREVLYVTTYGLPFHLARELANALKGLSPTRQLFNLRTGDNFILDENRV